MNIPATHKQVEELLPGEMIINKYPNRRTRRSIDKVPSSTKMAKCSLNNPNVIRTNKFNGNFGTKN